MKPNHWFAVWNSIKQTFETCFKSPMKNELYNLLQKTSSLNQQTLVLWGNTDRNFLNQSATPHYVTLTLFDEIKKSGHCYESVNWFSNQKWMETTGPPAKIKRKKS